MWQKTDLLLEMFRTVLVNVSFLGARMQMEFVEDMSDMSWPGSEIFLLRTM